MNISGLLKMVDSFYSFAKKENLLQEKENFGDILNKLEELETYGSRKRYADKKLKNLSHGSSRIVYSTPNKTVLKLAKNDKGIAQNKAEAKHLKNKSKYLNKLIRVAKNYAWIETRYLKKLSEKKFEELTGVNFNAFGDSIRYALKDISGSDLEKPEKYDEVSKTDIFKSVSKIGRKFKLMAGDLAKISSYGFDDKHPVLIDVGLTKSIFDKYYD